MKFSIIVPAYNVAPYIERCLNSVVADNYPDKELIVVNDGSTDNLIEVLAPFLEKFSWIKLINQSNQGLSAGRNVGLKNAVGDYVVFLDSDDFWLTPILEKFAKIITDKNCDVIKTDYVSVVGETPQFKKKLELPYLGECISSFEYLSNAIKNRHYEVVAVNAAFRREFLLKNNIFFREGLKYEDHEFTLRCILAGASFVQINDQYYGYYVRQGSITKCPEVSSVLDILFNFRMMRKLVENHARGGSAVSPDCYKPVSHIVYHALMVWWRLPAGTALRVSAAFSKDIVDFAIKYSYDKRSAKILWIFKLSPMLTYLLAQIKTYFTKKR